MNILEKQKSCDVIKKFIEKGYKIPNTINNKCNGYNKINNNLDPNEVVILCKGCDYFNIKKELQKELYNLLECSNCRFRGDLQTCNECPDYEYWELSEDSEDNVSEIYDVCKRLGIHSSNIKLEIRELNNWYN